MLETLSKIIHKHTQAEAKPDHNFTKVELKPKLKSSQGLGDELRMFRWHGENEGAVVNVGDTLALYFANIWWAILWVDVTFHTSLLFYSPLIVLQ